MKIAVGLLTCDRYGLTERTVRSLFEHNDTSDWKLFWADDASTDERIPKLVEGCGFEPVYRGKLRIGCTPASDAMLRGILRRTGPDWLVLYLQNDFESIRPFPLNVAEEFFAEPTNMALRPWYRARTSRRQRKYKWDIHTYGGEQVMMLRTCAWVVQLARLPWLSWMSRGAVKERNLHHRNKRSPNPGNTGIPMDHVFRHLGSRVNGRRTPHGIFHSASRFGSGRAPTPVIVSMTTIKSRIGRVADTIRSIARGSRRPDHFMLNVPHDVTIPKPLRRLPVSIVRCDDVGPATKLLPTLKRNWGENVLIVTADDDVLYPRRWLWKLERAARKTPNCIVCYRGRVADPTRGYRGWKTKKNIEIKPNFRILPLGVFGVAFRPKHFTEQVFDLDLMNRTTPKNDDLWFAATKRPDVPVRIIGVRGRFETLKLPGPRLFATNGRGENDRAIARLSEVFEELPWS